MTKRPLRRAGLTLAGLAALLFTASTPARLDGAAYDAYDVCIQGPAGSGNYFKINLATGDYELCCGGEWQAGGTAATQATGPGEVDFDGSTDHFLLSGKIDLGGESTVRADRRIFDGQPFVPVCQLTDGNLSNNDCSGCRSRVRFGATTTLGEPVVEAAPAGPQAAVLLVDGGAGDDRLVLLETPTPGSASGFGLTELLEGDELFGAAGANLGGPLAAGAIDQSFQPVLEIRGLDGADGIVDLTPHLQGVPPVVAGMELTTIPTIPIQSISDLAVMLYDFTSGELDRQILPLSSGTPGQSIALPPLEAPGNAIILGGFDNAMQAAAVADPTGGVGTIFQDSLGTVHFNHWDPSNGDRAFPLLTFDLRDPAAEPRFPVEPALAFEPVRDIWAAAFLVAEQLELLTFSDEPPHEVERFVLAEAPLASGAAFDFNQPALLTLPDGSILVTSVTHAPGSTRMWIVSPDSTVELLGAGEGDRGLFQILPLAPPPTGQPWDGTTSSILLSQGSLYLTELALNAAPAPPAGAWLSSPALPGYRFKALIGSGAGARVAALEDCIAETACLSGALPGRSELFLRLVGPKPNGHLWPNLVKFSTSRIQVWIEQPVTGTRRYYDLPAVGQGAERLDLAGLAHKTGFLPPAVGAGGAAVAAASEATGPAAHGLDLALPPRAAWAAGGEPAPPAGPWLESPALAGFRVKVQVHAGASPLAGRRETDCIEETLCVSGAIPARSEIFVRVVGPKPNGRLWPTLVKFSTSRLEVWIEQKSSGEVRYYDLPAVAAGGDLLPLAGLADRAGFLP
jgi:hypothetical protein